MAEATVVGALTQTFITMVTQKLFDEVWMFTSFREEFEFLCDELISIKCLLNDAAEKSNSTLMCNWLDSLEDFLIDAEDIVEECCTTPKFCTLMFKYRMGCKIKILKERINKINRSAQYVKYLSSVLHVNVLNAYNAEDLREKSSAFIRESHTLGMEHDIHIITNWILEDGYGVIAILGMGGLGKSLLLQHVFKSEKVREHFDHFIWLSVSQKFAAKQLLFEIRRQIKLPSNQNMAKLPTSATQSLKDSSADEVRNKKDRNISKQISKKMSFRSPQPSFRSRENQNQNLNEVSEEDLRYINAEVLRDMLHKNLQGKRILFALDDVWDKDVLEKIGLPFDTQNKIVLTSRDKTVAAAMRAHHIHNKTCLSEDNSWKLFCIHAFPELEEPPGELTNIAHLIVKKCSGLPLAIKTIAASMARVGRLPNDWESTLRRLNQPDFIDNRVMNSLTLSYHTLPYHLKHCFLFCAAFPKNSEIKSKVLVYLWIGQGLVSTCPQDAAQDVYDVGRSYLKELIDRCLMEDSPGGYCKMHDLLHDIALSESLKQIKCLLKAGGQLEKLPVEECQDLRRISLMKNNISTIKEAIRCPGLRTLLLSYNNDLTLISASFFNNLRYLAVLDLSHTSIHKLPETMGNLKHLKFLNLSSTSISMLPESFNRLRRLMFLDVSRCKRLRMLHSGIGNHKYMLHLNVKHCPYLEYLPVGISKLIHLHTLKGAVLKRQIAGKPSVNALQLSDLKRLILLQHLSLIIDTDDSTSLQAGTIDVEEGTFACMTNMRTLSIKSSWYSLPLSSSLLILPIDMEVMKRVEVVRLRRCAVPKWIFQRENLIELELEADNSSSGYDYRGLERIPNMRKLRLYRNEKCSELPEEFGQPTAFPKLQRLMIEDFKSLTTFPLLQDNAMPMLQFFGIKDCCKLTNMPQGLERLSSIEEIDLGTVDRIQYSKYLRHGHSLQNLLDGRIKLKIDIV